MNLPDEKEAIRIRVRERRRELEPAWVRQSSCIVMERVMNLPEFMAARFVACYMSLPREVQTMELIYYCWEIERPICVPAFDSGRAAYGMALVEKGAEMVPGAAGIMEPRVTCWVDPQEIEFIVVPGLAFDPSGVRLGQGGGHYDRYLALCPAFKAGVAFDFQMVDRVPRGEHDVPMNMVLTEKQVYRCGVEK